MLASISQCLHQALNLVLIPPLIQLCGEYWGLPSKPRQSFPKHWTQGRVDQCIIAIRKHNMTIWLQNWSVKSNIIPWMLMHKAVEYKNVEIIAWLFEYGNLQPCQPLGIAVLSTLFRTPLEEPFATVFQQCLVFRFQIPLTCGKQQPVCELKEIRDSALFQELVQSTSLAHPILGDPQLPTEWLEQLIQQRITQCHSAGLEQFIHFCHKHNFHVHGRADADADADADHQRQRNATICRLWKQVWLAIPAKLKRRYQYVYNQMKLKIPQEERSWYQNENHFGTTMEINLGPRTFQDSQCTATLHRPCEISIHPHHCVGNLLSKHGLDVHRREWSWSEYGGMQQSFVITLPGILGPNGSSEMTELENLNDDNNDLDDLDDLDDLNDLNVLDDPNDLH